VARPRDLRLDRHVRCVFGAREDVHYVGAYDFGVVVACAGFVEDEAFCWVLD
jgi:hypothetical protein